MSEENLNIDERNKGESDFALDFVTSSAISKISLKFLAFYIPIFWFGGFLPILSFLGLFAFFPAWGILIFLPIIVFAMYYVFFFGCILFTKLFLVLINLIHKPREGIFKAEEGDKDFEFWRLRIELKKIGVWLLNNCPLPWSDAWPFRWFGVKMDFSSHLNDAWCDVEFIEFGNKVTVGQAAVIMSSMVVGKYLIIKKVILEDYSVIGGIATISPGTIVGKDTMLGAASNTKYNQVLEPGWIYFGIPCIKLKPNKYGVSKKHIIYKKDVDGETKYKVEQVLDIVENNKNKKKS